MMKKFSMKCSCGDDMTVDAMTREEAIEKLKMMMTEDAIAKHFAEKHPGQPVPTKAEVDAMIEKEVMEMMPATMPA